ncbi:MAG: hypothetical protein KDK39_07675 [Leptospiraceae bacterium]|nr:hypothetical protein [Leptospiraceae bacterium]
MKVQAAVEFQRTVQAAEQCLQKTQSDYDVCSSNLQQLRALLDLMQRQARDVPAVARRQIQACVSQLDSIQRKDSDKASLVRLHQHVLALKRIRWQRVRRAGRTHPLDPARHARPDWTGPERIWLYRHHTFCYALRGRLLYNICDYDATRRYQIRATEPPLEIFPCSEATRDPNPVRQPGLFVFQFSHQGRRACMGFVYTEFVESIGTGPGCPRPAVSTVQATHRLVGHSLHWAHQRYLLIGDS